MFKRQRYYVLCYVGFHIDLHLLFVVKYERIKFLVIALPDSIDIYAWAPKPYHKFMVFKVCYQLVMLICYLWFASKSFRILNVFFIFTFVKF